MADKNEIKSHLDTLFVFASQVPYKSKHLLPVVQASKSLIGINLETIPGNLLKWLESYMTQFSPDQNLPGILAEEIKPEVISVARLQELVNGNNLQEGEKYLGYLLQVADPYHIAEYLLEVAAQQSAGTFLFCWSAYKSMLIMEPGDSIPVLYLCLGALFHKEFSERGARQNALSNFELQYHQYQIKQSNMVRHAKIITDLGKLLKNTNPIKQDDFNEFIPIELSILLNKDGLLGIHTFLTNLSIDKFRIELIFVMDALRSAIRFSKDWRSLPLFGFFKEEAEPNC